MELWKTRSESLKLLNAELSQHKFILDQCFRIMDHCIDTLEEQSDQSQRHRICAITLVKGKNYALACYSLMIDGLGQEAGATMRPMIEYIELLKYFRLFPDGVDLAFKEKLPKAGERAKKIKGIHKEIRDHLNESSSHSSFDVYSTRHLFDPETMTLRKVQLPCKIALEHNLRDLFIEVFFLIKESIECLNWLNGGIQQDLAEFADRLYDEGTKVFDIAHV